MQNELLSLLFLTETILVLAIIVLVSLFENGRSDKLSSQYIL